MKKGLFILLFFVFAAVPVKVAAQDTVEEYGEIDDRFSQHNFPLSDLEFFKDYSHHLTFEEVSAPEFHKNFKVNPAYTSKDYDDKAVYWVKLKIKHNSSSKKEWLMELYDQRIDDIRAYIPDHSGNYREYLTGDTRLFGERQFPHKNFVFLLDNSSDQVLTYFFRIKSEGAADIRIVLRSLNRFVYYALNEYLLFGIFYGMILIIGLYNFLMYSAFREKKYLIYLFYLVCVAIYAMCIDGLAFQYLWPNWPSLNKVAYGVAQYGIIIGALLFTKEFLNTRNRSIKANTILEATIFVRSIYFLYCLLVNPKFFEYGIIEIVPLLVMLWVSVYILYRGYRPARLVVIAFGVLLIGFLLKVLTNIGVLPFYIVLHYSLRFSFIVEMLLLSFALADQVRLLKDKKEKAQKRIIRQITVNAKLKEEVNKELAEKMALKEKVNQELEQKVKLRTLELQENNTKLEEANLKLLKQAQEINQINSLLDLDNWKLKNNLKKELNDRLLNKNLNYSEFQKLYPTEKACFEYLENFKKGQPFECRKCGNTKYTDSIKVYAKRCAKCGKSESATAYTLFHGIKFPIEKAFYIAYLTLHEHSHFTLDEISDSLALRRNTVWSFKQKVQTVKEHLELSRKGKQVYWEDMILTCPISIKSRGSQSA